MGLHENITLLFLPVGHTKFSTDWCFGLLNKFRRSVVSSLDGMARVVDESADVNTSQLVMGRLLCLYVRLGGLFWRGV